MYGCEVNITLTYGYGVNITLMYGCGCVQRLVSAAWARRSCTVAVCPCRQAECKAV